MSVFFCTVASPELPPVIADLLGVAVRFSCRRLQEIDSCAVGAALRWSATVLRFVAFGDCSDVELAADPCVGRCVADLLAV
jgi:hypothetical protein